ncbi:MAG: protein kinase [Pirellulales bacterium]|nr:protein kinase [Pirellulales bacterium]
MSAASADRNLLYGVLAVQLDFVSRDDLVAVTSRWVLDKEQPLSEIFIEQGMLSREEAQALDGVVSKHLERNGDDPRQSLQSIEAFEVIRSTLGELDDAEIRATVDYTTVGFASQQTSPNDTHSTQGPIKMEPTDSRNRFTILRTHQKGGLGRVSIALDEELNREIALKEILSAHADNQENRIRFVREAEITGALEHPGIVPVYSLGQFADGRPYYAMRFIRGINLQMALEDFYKQADRSADSQLRFRGLVAKIIHVCQALEYAHSRGVIHRDLKPGNIMLGDYGETLVVDWGLAKTLDEDAFVTDVATLPPVHASKRASSTSTQVGRVVGTPSYMSPEQAAGRLDALGPCSDIYSLGATLYHLLTGKPPFQGSEEEVLGNVQLGRFPRPREINSRIPRALEAICLRAMARLPDERYLSAREMAEDLERFMADEQVMAYAEPLPAKAWRWTRNHKPLVISSALALTVAVAALSISVVQLRSANVHVRASRDEARQNFIEAEKQRQIAERNFGLARQAVQEYYVTVSEETLLKQPGMQPLRDALLRQALVYYQRFLDEREEDSALREEVAQAHFFTGKITQSIDSPANALPHYRNAAELQKQLLEEDPGKKVFLSSYGQTLNAIGGALFRSGSLEEARESFQQAVDTREKLAKAEPENVEAARVLANSVMNMGSTYLAQRDLETAIPLMERAQMIRMAHTDRSETADPKLQRDLGKGYYQLALVRQSLGDTVLAENNFLTAIDTFQRLLASDPNEMSHQRNLAACQRMVGDIKSNARQPQQAIEYYRQATKVLESLTIRNPDVWQYTADLARVYMNLGQQLSLVDQAPAALKTMEQAVALLRDLSAMVPSYRLDLGVALRAAGKLQAQAERLEQARKLLEESKQVLSQLVKEDPTNDRFTSQLQHTNDEQARLAAQVEP